MSIPEPDISGVERTMRVGLVGSAIQASRSPTLHMQEAKALGIPLTYELFDLDGIEGGADALPGILENLRLRGYRGVNITHPVKQKVLALLDACSRDVTALGACNTVVFENGRSVGHNTDWSGFAESFRRGLPGAALSRVVQLGAGGAGSAVAYALLKLGAARIEIYDVDRARAESLSRRFGLSADRRMTVAESLAAALADADGVVNCTPLGMAKYPGIAMPESLLRPDLWVADIVYVPLRTEFLGAAERTGCRTLDGGGMAVFQAAGAFGLFTGAQPDMERMLAKFRADAAAEI